MYETEIVLLGVRVLLSSNDIEFNKFVRSSSLCGKNKLTQLGNSIQVEISFNRNIFKKADYVSINNARLNEYYGSEIFLAPNTIGWVTKKLSLVAKGTPEKYSVNAKLNYRLDQKIRLLFGAHREFVFNNYIYAHRFAILYPLFALCYPKWSLLHASAVLDLESNKAILFVGLNGVGKSSLAYSLSNLQGYKLLSDNYVLVCGNSIMPVPELLRMPRDLRRGKKYANPIGIANNKILLENAQAVAGEFVVDKTCVLSRYIGNYKSKIEELRKDESIDLIINLGSYLKEYTQHNFSSFFTSENSLTEYQNIKQLAYSTSTHKFTIGNEKETHTQFLRLIDR
jgi:hypothetical protein